MGSHVCRLPSCGRGWTCKSEQCVDNRTLVCLPCDYEITRSRVAALESDILVRKAHRKWKGDLEEKLQLAKINLHRLQAALDAERTIAAARGGAA